MERRITHTVELDGTPSGPGTWPAAESMAGIEALADSLSHAPSTLTRSALVLHAQWAAGAMHLWAELTDAEPSLSRSVDDDRAKTAPAISAHPFACRSEQLKAALVEARVVADETIGEHAIIHMRLPGDDAGPWPSDRLARLRGAVDQPIDAILHDHAIPALRLSGVQAVAALIALDDLGDAVESGIDRSHSLDYWIAVVRMVVDLLADQRIAPSLQHVTGHTLSASWQPWIHDEDGRARAGALVASMPPAVRAVIDQHHSRSWSILEEALRTLGDSLVRAALAAESFIDAIDGRDPADPHVLWLSGLLGPDHRIAAPAETTLNLLRDATLWLGRLDDTGQGRALHLCLRLIEPAPAEPDAKPASKDETAAWTISLHLQASDDANLLLDAEQIWNQPLNGQRLGRHRVDQPQELLLSELARAARLYPHIESALSERNPTRLLLTTAEAYEFLREIRPVLEESGIGVIVPEWWDQPAGQLAARLHIESPEDPSVRGEGVTPTASMLGLNSLVRFHWQIAVGDQPLTPEEFRALARNTAPLVQVRGKWIEINAAQLADAQALLKGKAEGEMTLLEAIHLAHGVSGRTTNLPISGMDATGWVADVLGASTNEVSMPHLDQPTGFIGTLRPYQKSGLSWMAFLDRYGLGACLADDMGLGKTIQLIALLQYERQASSGATIPPTLLVVPTSVVANWTRELKRFAPELTVHVQHGPDRPVGERFVQVAATRDVVITTYPLVSRDQDTLSRVKWHRVALDEAQYIKNPPTKQTTAIRSLHAPHRLALTGTPVENRLSELWSIMEFCNPGYLGVSGEFRRRFSMAIERRRDPRRAEHLKRLVRPFVLRRVKTDPNVINDLPPCVETKEYATLTPEQAAMYQTIVDSMLGQVERAEGIQRRGLVLATLVRLKQICNHPAQIERAVAGGKNPFANIAVEKLAAVTEEGAEPPESMPDGESPASLNPSRSGKAQRLLTMLEEVLATGEKALIFTQFRQMGHLLTAMIQKELDCEALFLHGGTPVNKRQHLIDRFQAVDGGAPVFVLSLKAGGVGLNLTAANHVFHYDRWWNPAVENQATDRAFRIGQTRTVHVHKFVCIGTLEERIDQMIEQKTELARNIIGVGEQWLTELSTGQLRDLLMLRSSAIQEVES